MSIWWKFYLKRIFLLVASLAVIGLITLLVMGGFSKIADYAYHLVAWILQRLTDPNWNWDWKHWTVFGLSLGILLFVYLLAFLLGQSKTIITMPKEGEIELAVRGESFLKIIPNIKGYGTKEDEIEADIGGKIIKIKTPQICPTEEGGKPPRKFLGLALVGLFIPFDKILRYDFSWDKAISKATADEEKKKGASVEETSFGDLWLSHRTEKVSSLYFRYTYPIIVRNIELAGRYPIDIYFNVTVEAVYPVIPVFYLKGRWFTVLSSKFGGVISDLLRGMELKDFEEMEKEDFFNGKVKEENNIFLKATGMKIFHAAYRDYQPSGTLEEKTAASAEKVAKLRADARKQEAEGEGAALEREGVAKAKNLERLLEQASKHPLGGQILIEQFRKEGLEGFSGNFLSLGQAQPAAPMIGVDAGGTGGKNKKTGKKKQEPEEPKEEEEE